MFVNSIFVYILLVLTINLLFTINTVFAEPEILSSGFKVKQILIGNFGSSSMAFLDEKNILVLDRDNGRIYLVNVYDSTILQEPVLDVDVSTNGFRGLLGIAIDNKIFGSLTHPYVYLYYTESQTSEDGSDENNMNNIVEPAGNRIYRYEFKDNKLVNPKLILNLPSLPGPHNAGGIIEIGPDNNLYILVGDLTSAFNKKYKNQAINDLDGKLPDGRGGILRINLADISSNNNDNDFYIVHDNGIIGNDYPQNLYYAYGIRNGFGIDWDPITGNLWDTENGPLFGDEINLVMPGFNNGWSKVQGIWKPEGDKMGKILLEPSPSILVDFNGKGYYSPPEFIWKKSVGPSAIKFLTSKLYGSEYENDLFVGDVNLGNLYHFELSGDRTSLEFQSKILKDKIANSHDEIDDSIIFGKNFEKISDIEISPDGYMYILSSQKNTNLYKIIP